MRRRDFLWLRTAAATRVAELSCERLYMRFQQTVATTAGRAARVVPPADGWDEEPADVRAGGTTAQLFSDVERRLQGADVVRVSEPEWLSDESFGRHVDAVLAGFRRRGGRVEQRASDPSGRGPSSGGAVRQV